MRPGAGDRDDAALLRAVSRGDDDALAALYDRHAGWLTIRLTHRCALPDVVDHAVQDTFLALWRAGQSLLAAPVLMATGWAQLALMDHTIAGLSGTGARPPAIYPLLAQLTGWCAVAVAAAACCDRSRYADLGGAVAAPVTLAVIASAWYLPQLSRVLLNPPATAGDATAAWYGVAAGALVLTGVAMRDRWPRYTRALRAGRPGSGGGSGSPG
jgi:hypothetical protein